MAKLVLIYESKKGSPANYIIGKKKGDKVEPTKDYIELWTDGDYLVDKRNKKWVKTDRQVNGIWVVVKK